MRWAQEVRGYGGAATVTGTLTLSQVPRVKVGQRVWVVPAGWDHALAGKIARVGLNATTDTSGTISRGTSWGIAGRIRGDPMIGPEVGLMTG